MTDTDIELRAAADELLATAERWHRGGCHKHEPLHNAAGRYGRAKAHWHKVRGGAA